MLNTTLIFSSRAYTLSTFSQPSLHVLTNQLPHTRRHCQVAHTHNPQIWSVHHDKTNAPLEKKKPKIKLKIGNPVIQKMLRNVRAETLLINKSLIKEKCHLRVHLVWVHKAMRAYSGVNNYWRMPYFCWYGIYMLKHRTRFNSYTTNESLCFFTSLL